MAEGVPPELMLGDGEWNIGRFIGDDLIERFGFEADPDASGGVYRRIIDSENAVEVLIDGWSRVPGGGTPMPRPIFGVARRDINELWHELLDERMRPWAATVSEQPWFFDRERMSFRYSSSPADVSGWLDDVIPQLVARAPHWSFVKAHMELSAALPTKAGRMKVQFPRMMTALMEGWNDAAEEEFLSPMIAQLDEIWDLDPDGSMRRAKIERIRAWIEEHPDGVEREMIDS